MFQGKTYLTDSPIKTCKIRLLTNGPILGTYYFNEKLIKHDVLVIFHLENVDTGNKENFVLRFTPFHHISSSRSYCNSSQIA